MGFKLVRIDADEPVKIPLDAGVYIIGRGSFLNCDDKRVSREHGVIVVNPNSVQLKSLHQNPCFYNKLNVNKTDVLSKGKTVDLKHTDHFGLLPTSYWYELIHCDDESGDDGKTNVDVSHPKRHLDELTAKAKEEVNNGIDPETQQYSFVMDDLENDKVKSPPTEKRPHSPDSTNTKRIKTGSDNSIEEDSCTPMPQSSVKTSTPVPQTSTQGLNPDVTPQSRIPDTNSSGNRETSEPTENADELNVTEENSANNLRPAEEEYNTSTETSLNEPETSLNMELDGNDENNESQSLILNADVENLMPDNIQQNNDSEATGRADHDTEQQIPDPKNSNENVGQVNEVAENIDPAFFDEDMETKSDNINSEQPKTNAVKTEPQSPDKIDVKKEPKSPDDVKNGDSEAGPSNQPGTSSDGAANAPPNRPPARERCMYGASCYRKNPQHMAQYSHPKDSDYGDAGQQGVCPYGAACRRRNPRHWAEQQHPPGTAPPVHRQGIHLVRRQGNIFYINAREVHFHDDHFEVEDDDGDSVDYDYEF